MRNSPFFNTIDWAWLCERQTSRGYFTFHRDMLFIRGLDARAVILLQDIINFGTWFGRKQIRKKKVFDGWFPYTAKMGERRLNFPPKTQRKLLRHLSVVHCFICQSRKSNRGRRWLFIEASNIRCALQLTDPLRNLDMDKLRKLRKIRSAPPCSSASAPPCSSHITEESLRENRKSSRRPSGDVGDAQDASTFDGEPFIPQKELKSCIPSSKDKKRAAQLMKAIADHFHRNPILSQINRFAPHFTAMRKIDGIHPKDIDAVLKWYCANMKGDHVPDARSGKSFRKKYNNVISALERLGFSIVRYRLNGKLKVEVKRFAQKKFVHQEG